MDPYNSGEFFADIPRIPGVEAVAIISADGIPIASLFPQGVDESRIAAMTATLLTLSKKAIVEMKKGNFNETYIKGSDGYLLIMQAGPNAILIVSIMKDARLGLIRLDCRRMCEKIAGLLGKYDDDDGDDYLPYPYIFKPPEPPIDIGVAPRLQVNKFMDKEPENEEVCQYCGRKLTEEERFSHNCRKSPE